MCEDVIKTNDKGKCNELKTSVVETFLTYQFVANADQNKHGSLMARFCTDRTLVDGDKSSECPTALERAVAVMTNHEWDKAHHENKRKRKEHKKESPKKLEEHSAFAHIGKGKCYCCGKRTTIVLIAPSAFHPPSLSGAFTRTRKFKPTSN